MNDPQKREIDRGLAANEISPEAATPGKYENADGDTFEAIRRGLADVEAGRVRPAREALAELRRKHNPSNLI